MTAVTRLLLCIIYCAVPLAGLAQRNDWQQELRYKIDVTLNDTTHSMTGYMELVYKNNSPDTLGFIWFHVWPNAFKNDKTAFSEHQLENGNTAFYFAKPADRGYINRLDFRAGITSLEVEDHPVHTDIIKVILPQPLYPGQETIITTPFFIKLPRSFDGFGHDGIGGQSYQLSHWYPSPAVYDSKGWHAMPYLNENTLYNEFADYELKLTLPGNYLVASNANLQNQEEWQWLRTKTSKPQLPKIKPSSKKQSFKKQPVQSKAIPSDRNTKTLLYTARANRLVLFADKHFWIDTAVVKQSSGQILNVMVFKRHRKKPIFPALSMETVLEAVRFNDSFLGDYANTTMCFVEPETFENVSAFTPRKRRIHPYNENIDREVHRLITRNWLLTNSSFNDIFLLEGMTEYINDHFNQRQLKYDTAGYYDYLQHNHRLKLARTVEQAVFTQQRAQPLSTGYDSLTIVNKLLMPVMSAEWLRMIEADAGPENFQIAMRRLFSSRKQKGIDRKNLNDELQRFISPQAMSAFTKVPDTTGMLIADKPAKKLVFAPLFERSPDHSASTIYITPAAGYNRSDDFMAGAAIHNYGLKYNRFRFFASALYGFQSKKINGLADLGYTWRPSDSKHKILFGAGFARFSTLRGIDSNANRISAGFIKFTPAVKWILPEATLLSTTEKWIEWKTFIIGESGFTYHQKSTDEEYYPETSGVRYRYINQLTFGLSDSRVLYPYAATLQAQQARDFFRLNLDARFFFNYPSGGGMNIRLFAAGFGYIGSRSASSSFSTARYQPKLTAVRGSEDYTYSNYFIGRNESDGLASQQIMIRDGGLKIRTDLFQDMQGRSGRWVSSVNLSSAIPVAGIPVSFPLRLFFDIGTYAEAWKEDATGTRFLYTGGLQLSLFKNILNIYAPVIYSKAFSDVLRTVPEENKFFRKLSFTIDFQKAVSKKVGKSIIE
jgi:hypothetical protein